LLQKLPIFSTIHDDQKIDALLADGVLKQHTYPKDKDIVRQGEEGDSLFVIGSGSAEALLAVAKEETIRLSTMREGDVFGEMAFFGRRERAAGRRERAATVRAKEDCTVLEIGGPEFQKLVDEYPDIRSRLLLLMGERLRDTNEQILALHLKTVDEKLKLFNNRLDNEQRSVEAVLTAAQTVFDQTKIRTDEVISSAERSRDRLHKYATLVGGVVTVLVTLLGLFGWKQVSDIAGDAKTAREMKDKMEEQLHKALASASSAGVLLSEMGKRLGEAEKSADDLSKLKVQARDLRDSMEHQVNLLIGLQRTRFLDALDSSSGVEAVEAWRQIKKAGSTGDELAQYLGEMERKVVAKAQAPPERSEDQPPSKLESSVKNFVNLFQQAVVDAEKPRDKLNAYYVLLVYAYLTRQERFEQNEGDYRSLGTRKDALAALEKYSKSVPKETPWREETKDLKDNWLSQGGDKDVLRMLSHLALVSVGRD
jgi:CRP-like cAMP-binding protein